MDAQAGGKSTTTWVRALLAPGLSLVRPRMAAAWMATAPRWACVVVAVLGLLIYASVLVLLMLWEETVQFTWTPNSGFFPATDVRSFGRVWAEWHATARDGWFGPAEFTLTMVLLLGPLLVLLLGWLNLPVVHRTGSVWRAYTRAVRASVLMLSPITVATTVCGTGFILLEHERYSLLFTPVGDVEPGIVLFLCIAIALWLLVWWLRRATAGAVVGEALAARPPLCEGCGYDLTYQPAEGRCPECGLVIAASLIAETSRPGSGWARQKSFASWRSTSHGVLARPGAFYRRLQLRTPAGAEAGFAVRHYVGIALGAALWAGVLGVLLSVQEGPPPAGERVNIALAVGAAILSGVFGCWLGQRAIGALVVTWWSTRKALPDTGWAAKVLVYETTFLWVFCAFWGLLIASYALAGPWLSHLVLPPDPRRSTDLFFILGIPIEAWAVAIGTLVLGLLWLWRYDVAYRSIRWSNF